MKEIELGCKVKSIISGFTGIVTARTEYINGCVRYGVTPKVDKEGKEVEAKWIDEQELKRVGQGVNIAPKKTGGPQNVAPSRYGA